MANTFQDISLDRIKYKTIKTNKRIEFLNLECAFDIETTSTYTENKQKVGYMYAYTMGIGTNENEQTWMGRTWEDFISDCVSIQKHFGLSEDRRLICYVQNLEFEFQFIQRYFSWVDVFATSERKVLRALTTLGIEFRDSYLLSGMSLENMANGLDVDIPKMMGDLDYSLVRHHLTKLTEKEEQYCINDVRILLYYIKREIEIYGDITRIPYTNTGRVRKFVRDNCFYTSKSHKKSSPAKYRKYREMMDSLKLDLPSYKMLKQGFMGGFTHSNVRYNAVVLDNVDSYDFNSSYPAVMVSEKFPMSRPIKVEIKSKEEFEDCIKNFAYIFEVEFTGLESTSKHENYLSFSKCMDSLDVEENNGRIVKAKMVKMVITEVDFEIIQRNYTWTEMKVGLGYKFYKRYLPKEIIKSIIELYKKKTELKGVKGMEVEYNLNKGMLNSVYGMAVMDVIRTSSVWQDGWESEIPDEEKQIADYNSSHSRFLYYPWGIWITAYARRNLWTGILAVGEDYVYSDTDSIKIRNSDKHQEYFRWYNGLLIKKIKLLCDFRNLDFNDFMPLTIKGERKIIGVWEKDASYKRFKTLGAKRYLVEYENGELEMTVSGLSKKSGIIYLKELAKQQNLTPFDVFAEGLSVDGDSSGKLTHTYIDSEVNFTAVDYLGCKADINAKSGIHLEKSNYHLSISDKYLDFIEKMMLEGYIYKGEV